MAKLEYSYTAAGNAGSTAEENSLSAPQKVKHRISISPHYSTSRYMPKRILRGIYPKILNTGNHVHVHAGS